MLGPSSGPCFNSHMRPGIHQGFCLSLLLSTPIDIGCFVLFCFCLSSFIFMNILMLPLCESFSMCLSMSLSSLSPLSLHTPWFLCWSVLFGPVLCLQVITSTMPLVGSPLPSLGSSILFPPALSCLLTPFAGLRPPPPLTRMGTVLEFPMWAAMFSIEAEK